MRAAVPGFLSSDAIWKVKADQYKQADLRQQKRDELREEAWRLSGMTEDADCDSSVECATVVAARAAKELASAKLIAEARAVVAEQPSVDIAACDSEISNDGMSLIAPVDCHIAAIKAENQRRFSALFDSDDDVTATDDDGSLAIPRPIATSRPCLPTYAARRPSETSTDDNESQATPQPKATSRHYHRPYAARNPSKTSTDDDEFQAKLPSQKEMPRPTEAFPINVTQTQVSTVHLYDDNEGDALDDEAFDTYLDNHALQFEVENMPASLLGLVSVRNDNDGLSHDGDALNRHEGNLMEVPYSFDTPPNKGSKRQEAMLESDIPTPLRLWSGVTRKAKGISEADNNSLSFQLPNYSLKPRPRPTVIVRDLIRTGAFFIEAKPLTQADCCLRLAEYGEAVGIVSKRNGNNQEAVVKATCPSCPFKLGWNKNELSTGTRWVASKHIPHHALCFGSTAANKPHSMTAAQAAPALYQLIKDNPKLAINVAKKALAAYVEKIPSDAYVGRAITAAWKDTTGTVNDQAALIMCMKQALEADGHELCMLEMTKEGQQNLITDKDKQDHMKQRKRYQLTKGDEGYDYVEPPDLFAALEKHPSRTRFLYGYTLRLKHMSELVSSLKTVFSCDAAHMKGKLGGTAFGTWGQDANKNIVCVALSMFFDNEGFDTWSAHIGKVKN